jgi:hypothetical protein
MRCSQRCRTRPRSHRCFRMISTSVEIPISSPGTPWALTLHSAPVTFELTWVVHAAKPTMGTVVSGHPISGIRIRDVIVTMKFNPLAFTCSR